MKPVAILTNGPITWSSSRMRGFWLAEAAPDRFRVFSPGDELDGVDACGTVIFQKRYNEADILRARYYREAGRRVVSDWTDPMWWWSPREVQAMFELSDAITASNEGLAQAIRANPQVKAPVTVIPDRMPGNYHPNAVRHFKHDPIRLVWFGAAGNRVALLSALPLIEYVSHVRRIELWIIDEAPETPFRTTSPLEVVGVRWTLETFHAQLTQCDIAVLPPYPGPWGSMKSNNKAVEAGWCGLPVWDDFDLARLLALIDDARLRNKTGQAARKMAEEQYEIQRSVDEFLAVAEGQRRSPHESHTSREWTGEAASHA